jgi:hypothetical protein
VPVSQVRSARPIPGLLVLDGCFNDEELAQLVTAALGSGLQTQQVGVARIDGLPERRQRGETDAVVIASLLASRIGPHVPDLPSWFVAGEEPRVAPAVAEWTLAGFNPWSRVYRYGLGERFALHVDEPWRPRSDRRSFLTVLVYLPTAEPCIGGETVIADVVVAPEVGRCVLFDHRLMHEGKPGEGGEKLVIRSDAVYEVGT